MTNKFDLREEARTIARIAQRASQIAANQGFEYTVMDADMDITYVHKYTPLDLDGLLEARHSDFCHDVFGIRRHFNRETKTLEDCFHPRLARREKP